MNFSEELQGCLRQPKPLCKQSARLAVSILTPVKIDGQSREIPSLASEDAYIETGKPTRGVDVNVFADRPLASIFSGDGQSWRLVVRAEKKNISYWIPSIGEWSQDSRVYDHVEVAVLKRLNERQARAAVEFWNSGASLQQVIDHPRDTVKSRKAYIVLRSALRSFGAEEQIFGNTNVRQVASNIPKIQYR